MLFHLPPKVKVGSHRQLPRVLPKERDASLERAAIAAWNQAIDTAHQRSLAAPARAGNKQQFTLVERERQIFNSGMLSNPVLKGQVLYGERWKFVRWIAHAATRTSPTKLGVLRCRR